MLSQQQLNLILGLVGALMLHMKRQGGDEDLIRELYKLAEPFLPKE